MGLTILIILVCLIFGAIAAISARGPIDIELPDFSSAFSAKDLQRFSPKKTLFIIGPADDHAACKLQRRLVKPALAALIREDIAVMEVYGDDTPTKNGEPLDWLDPALLRHAMDAEEGFVVAYVDEDGKTVFRSETPMPTAELAERTGARHTRRTGEKRSAVLRKLQAA